MDRLRREEKEEEAKSVGFGESGLRRTVRAH